MTRGGVSLPVYRCARRSTPLHAFHLYLNRFILGESQQPSGPESPFLVVVLQTLMFLFSVTGTNVSGVYFQMYLLEGLTKWNEDRAQGAAGEPGPGAAAACRRLSTS